MSDFKRTCECGRETEMQFYYQASKNGKDNGKFDIFSKSRTCINHTWQHFRK